MWNPLQSTTNGPVAALGGSPSQPVTLIFHRVRPSQSDVVARIGVWWTGTAMSGGGTATRRFSPPTETNYLDARLPVSRMDERLGLAVP